MVRTRALLKTSLIKGLGTFTVSKTRTGRRQPIGLMPLDANSRMVAIYSVPSGNCLSNRSARSSSHGGIGEISPQSCEGSLLADLKWIHRDSASLHHILSSLIALNREIVRLPGMNPDRRCCRRPSSTGLWFSESDAVRSCARCAQFTRPVAEAF
jgi:hypothetical protein